MLEEISPSDVETVSCHSLPMDGLNVVVTGGSTGIGRSIVELFARNGHNVMFTYHSNLQEAEKLVGEWKGLCQTHYLDQGDWFSVAQFAHKALPEWLNGLSRNKVDVLINNAALGSATVKSYLARQSPTIPPNIPPELHQEYLLHMEDEALMKVNSLGPVWLTEMMQPLLDSTHSTIIFLGSVGGSTAVFPEYRVADLMSKAAITYAAKHLAAQNVKGHGGQTVLCIAPGATMTEMFKQSTLSRHPCPEKLISSFPKKRLVDPMEIAQLCYFCATNVAGRVLHGSVIDASLGLGVRAGLQTEYES